MRDGSQNAGRISFVSDLDRYEYGYDQDSNRQWKANVVGTLAVSSRLDEFYTYDPLNRLTKMQRGVLTGGPPPTATQASQLQGGRGTENRLEHRR
jgi:hypothetical protein